MCLDILGIPLTPGFLNWPCSFQTCLDLAFSAYLVCQLPGIPHADAVLSIRENKLYQGGPLSLGTPEAWGQVLPCSGAVLGAAGCLTASLVSTGCMPWGSPPQFTEDVFRRGQMSLGDKNCPQLRTPRLGNNKTLKVKLGKTSSSVLKNGGRGLNLRQ